MLEKLIFISIIYLKNKHQFLAIKTIYNVSLFSVYVGAAGIAVERTIGALLMGSSATAKKWISIGLVALQVRQRTGPLSLEMC